MLDTIDWAGSKMQLYLKCVSESTTNKIVCDELSIREAHRHALCTNRQKNQLKRYMPAQAL